MTNSTTRKGQPLLKSTLAELYGVTVHTLLRWMKRIPNLTLDKSKLLTPAQVEKVVAHLGAPDGWE